MNCDMEFIQWVKLYSERLMRIAYSYVKDKATAEDRVQDAFIKAFHHAHQLKDKENPFPWLARIVINECKSAQRKKWVEKTGLFLHQQKINSAEETYFRQKEFDRVHHAVLTLPEKYRTPIILFHFEELSIWEIAQVLDRSAGAIKTRLVRARKRLQILLEEDEKYEDGRKAPRSKEI